MDQQAALALVSAISGAGSSLVIPILGAVALILAAWVGTRAAATINANAAIRVAEINREAQRLLALDASRREWRKHLIQPLLDEMQRRSELYAQIDEAARRGDGNAVKALVDQLGPTALETRVMALLHQVPAESNDVLGEVALAENGGWEMAQAAIRGPIGPDSRFLGRKQAETTLTRWRSCTGDRFVHSTDDSVTVGDVLRRVRARESGRSS